MLLLKFFLNILLGVIQMVFRHRDEVGRGMGMMPKIFFNFASLFLV